MDLPPKVVDAYLQTTVPSFEYPRPDLPPTVRFVGPILAPPSEGFAAPAWWDELNDNRPVVHVTQGTLDNADLGRLLLPTAQALADADLLVMGAYSHSRFREIILGGVTRDILRDMNVPVLMAH